MDEWLTTKELSRRLGVQPRTIRRWARLGLIPNLRISPKVIRFSLEDVARVLRERGRAKRGPLRD